ncbi:MAG TPA: aminotransferase class I/II-fold pyridoxal phosphate-dependent enzyme [Thermoanaerobaculia bacterium]|nr:aminotransferase class I/II-fold pyridoxal phosphate-dependent enzyme [Thermoanaerobaculia bacterium]
MRFETTAVQVAGEPDETTGAIAPPIHLSTTFERDEHGETPRGYSYIRDANPTQTRLEQALAAIDGAASALTFASGMAAGAALLQSIPRGSHVIFPDDCYYGFRILANDYFPNWGLDHDFVTMDDLDAVTRLLRPSTKVLWAETPSNPLMKISDLAALASLAHGRGAILVVDGTFATPALQRPIEHGADVVLHATTKYLGGHSDVQGGSLAFRAKDDLYSRTEHTRTIGGTVASPFNSWLVLRGIRTLAARMRVHCENASAVAAFLSMHQRVEEVHFPGLPSHPGHDIARRQMSDFGGMLSFGVRGGGAAGALAVTSRVRLFRRATSLGGVESLVEHRASSEGPTTHTPPNLLRLSIGLEHPDDLIADLEQALALR